MEGDNPRKWMEGLNAAEVDVQVGKLLLEGKTTQEIAEGWGLTPQEVRGVKHRTGMHIRLAEVQRDLFLEVLKNKKKALDKLSGTMLMALTQWAEDLLQNNKHKDMTIDEGAKLLKMFVEAMGQRALLAGKATQRTEVVHKNKKVEASKVIEVVDPKHINDPFAEDDDSKEEGSGSENI